MIFYAYYDFLITKMGNITGHVMMVYRWIEIMKITDSLYSKYCNDDWYKTHYYYCKVGIPRSMQSFITASSNLCYCHNKINHSQGLQNCMDFLTLMVFISFDQHFLGRRKPEELLREQQYHDFLRQNILLIRKDTRSKILKNKQRYPVPIACCIIKQQETPCVSRTRDKLIVMEFRLLL